MRDIGTIRLERKGGAFYLRGGMEGYVCCEIGEGMRFRIVNGDYWIGAIYIKRMSKFDKREARRRAIVLLDGHREMREQAEALALWNMSEEKEGEYYTIPRVVYIKRENIRKRYKAMSERRKRWKI